MWIVTRDTALKPGSGEQACGWQLCVKRGEPGRSAFESAKTATGFRGSESDWVRSLRAPRQRPRHHGND